MPRVFLNGELVEEAEATVSVFDHGLVVGDGVFETVLVHAGRPFALARHLERLERSAAGLGLISPGQDVVGEAVFGVVADAGWEEGRIRITLTSGDGVLGSSRGGGRATLVVALGPLGAEHPVSDVVTVAWTRNEHGALAGLKTTSYAENARALAAAEAAGADEAVFANTSGALCEGTGSNVFVVLDGRLLTPPLTSGCLAGVTRDLLLEAGVGEEGDVAIADFHAERLDEAFLASTIRGVQPIGTIDGSAMRAAPGHWTAAAASVYRGLLDAGAC